MLRSSMHLRLGFCHDDKAWTLKCFHTGHIYAAWFATRSLILIWRQIHTTVVSIGSLLVLFCCLLAMLAPVIDRTEGYYCPYTADQVLYGEVLLSDSMETAYHPDFLSWDIFCASTVTVEFQLVEVQGSGIWFWFLRCWIVRYHCWSFYLRSILKGFTVLLYWPAGCSYTICPRVECFHAFLSWYSLWEVDCFLLRGYCNHWWSFEAMMFVSSVEKKKKSPWLHTLLKLCVWSELYLPFIQDNVKFQISGFPLDCRFIVWLA